MWISYEPGKFQVYKIKGDIPKFIPINVKDYDECLIIYTNEICNPHFNFLFN